MSDDPTSDAAATQMLATYGQVFSIESSLDAGDSSDAWIGYESAFPFSLDDLSGVPRL